MDQSQKREMRDVPAYGDCVHCVAFEEKRESFLECYPGLNGLLESLNDFNRTQALYSLALFYGSDRPMFSYFAADNLRNYLYQHPCHHGLHCMQAQKWRGQDSSVFVSRGSSMEIKMQPYFQDIIEAMLEACEIAEARLTHVFTFLYALRSLRAVQLTPSAASWTSSAEGEDANSWWTGRGMVTSRVSTS
ncbi:hypothetical protein SKAU_G00195590 [Synaphobranchus kaupii]|uniref:Uncharacterized protein n=1 Tax=Synaphobranchus kaupii TaxID=118154 RepID=A0A9Q1FET6_SYNKA|nr:hypothetical protein SKAU_G00195590 [Synaphobranchus kaupii]